MTKRYKIMAEAHEGVFSVDEECLAVIEAATDLHAMDYYADNNPRVSYIPQWNCFVINGARKIWAEEEKT